MSFQIEIDKEIKSKRLYFVGDALPPDWYAAFKLWLPLAQAGDAKAQFNVGRCYQKGDGVELNLETAESWFLKASGQGDSRALLEIEAIASQLRDQQKAEKHRKHQAEVSNSFRAIQALMNKGLYAEAKQAIQDNTDTRMPWIKNYLPCFEVEIESYISTEIDTEYEKSGSYTHVTSGSLTTTHADYNKKNWIISTANIEVKNKSEKKLMILFDDGIRLSIDKLSTAIYKKKNTSPDVQKIKQYHFLTSKGRNKRDTEIGFIVTAGEVIVDNEKFEFGSYDNELIFKLKDEISIPGKQIKTGCFVLTACFGDENHPTVISFRNFRDSYLLENRFGKKAVDFYYQHGPKVAQGIRRKPTVMLLLRACFRVVAAMLPKKI